MVSTSTSTNADVACVIAVQLDLRLHFGHCALVFALTADAPSASSLAIWALISSTRDIFGLRGFLIFVNVTVIVMNDKSGIRGHVSTLLYLRNT